MTPAPKAAPLLGLPRELRDEIWARTITSELIKRYAFLGAIRASKAPPAIMHASQQIRHEASAIYYEAITLHFESLSQCKKWLECFAPVMTVEDKEIRIATWSDEDDVDSLLSRRNTEQAVRASRVYAREFNALEAVVRGLDVQTRIKIVAFVNRDRGKGQWVTGADIEAMNDKEIQQCRWAHFRGMAPSAVDRRSRRAHD